MPALVNDHPVHLAILIFQKFQLDGYAFCEEAGFSLWIGIYFFLATRLGD